MFSKNAEQPKKMARVITCTVTYGCRLRRYWRTHCHKQDSSKGFPALRTSILCIIFLLGLGQDANAKPRRASRAGETGWLLINCPIKGALVNIDGQEVAVIPILAPLKVPVGKHTLKITKRGYTEFLDVFSIRRAKTTTLDVDLLPYAGILLITATAPDARVFIDGKFMGTTPLEQEILIGTLSVRISKAGYYDFITNIQSIAGKVKKLHAAMIPLPVGSNPYRPKPMAPPKWYEKWYVWAGAAGGLVAVTLAIVLPVSLGNKDKVGDFKPEYRWQSN